MASSIAAQVKTKVSEEEKKADNYKAVRISLPGRSCKHAAWLQEAEKLAKKVAESREVLQASWRGALRPTCSSIGLCRIGRIVSSSGNLTII